MGKGGIGIVESRASAEFDELAGCGVYGGEVKGKLGVEGCVDIGGLSSLSGLGILVGGVPRVETLG